MRVTMIAAISCAGALMLMTGATAASAATQNLTYDCYQSAPVTVNVAPGDVLAFTSNCGGGPGATAVNTSLFTSYPATFSSWPQTFVVTPGLAPGTYGAAFRMFAASTTTYTLVYSLSNSAPVEAAPPPPNWHQSYVRAGSDPCLQGWSASWAQWPHGGRGGFVCNRTLTWQGSAVEGQ